MTTAYALLCHTKMPDQKLTVNRAWSLQLLRGALQPQEEVRHRAEERCSPSPSVAASLLQYSSTDKLMVWWHQSISNKQDLLVSSWFLSLAGKTTSCSPAKSTDHHSCGELVCSRIWYFKSAQQSDGRSSNRKGLGCCSPSMNPEGSLWGLADAHLHFWPFGGQTQLPAGFCAPDASLQWTLPLVRVDLALPLLQGPQSHHHIAGNASATPSREYNTLHAELPVWFHTPDKPTECRAATKRHPLLCHHPICLLLGIFFFFFWISFSSVTLPEPDLCRISSASATLQGEDHNAGWGCRGGSQLAPGNVKLQPGRDLPYRARSSNHLF